MFLRTAAVSKGSRCLYRTAAISSSTSWTAPFFLRYTQPVKSSFTNIHRSSQNLRSFASFPSAMADTAPESGVTPELLKDKLTNQLDAQYVEIEDMSGGCGQAFQAIIVSPQFDKKTALARHRLVNSVLKEEIAAIHAWTPKCYTPEQWEKLKEGQA